MTPKSKYDSTKIEVKWTGEQKGRGVFAKARIEKDHLVEKAPTIELAKPGDISAVQETDLAYYTFELEGITHLGLGYTSLYNHSDEPNTRLIIAGRSITVTAARDIAKGEELTHDYGWGKEWTGKFKD